MFRTLITATAICAALSAPAFAFDHGHSHCGWEQGVLVCRAQYETDDATTYTLCASGGVDGGCTTRTIEKEKPKPPPSYEPTISIVPDSPSWHLDPSKWRDSRSTSLCPKPHRMTEDGCQ